MINQLEIKRRDAIKLLLATAAASAVTACRSESKDGVAAEAVPEVEQFLTAGEMTLLTTFAGLIIPKTDTPGAVEAGVPATIQSLLTGWGDDTIRTHWREGLAGINSYFVGLEGGAPFMDMDKDSRFEQLREFDIAVYKNQIENDFYKDMKNTIATAYYMSEPGATEELLYDPVPGDFKGCIDFEDVGKAWAT